MPRRTRPRAALALAIALGTGCALIVPASASAATAPDPVARDYCQGQCNDVLPPGENGNATAAQILAFKALGTRPAHTDDQLGKYASLVDGYTGLTNSKLGDFFNNSSFGVPAGQVASTTDPGGRDDVTIVRDKAEGIPHIYGSTRAGTEFGAGYAAAQDRLWLMDVFRHVGRGELSGFAGGAAGNRQLEQSFFSAAPYTEDDLQAQIDRVAQSGPKGEQALQDATNYVDGINAYISHAKSHLNWPGEYDFTGNANILTGKGIKDFKLTDLVAIAAVVGALFGSGGGGEVQSALVKLAAEHKYGTAEGDKVWRSFREENDPEADLTLHDGQTFPYAASPADPKGVAMPDPGSVVKQQEVFDPTGSAASDSSAAVKSAHVTAKAAAKTRVSHKNLARDPAMKSAKGSMNDGVLPGDLLTHKHGMSNALVVGGKYTDDGHPIAVFGPQTGYFAPQLLMLEELQGPGISARGAAFAGLSMYVELGRGEDYSWSATSASQDITDTYAVKLCNTDGSAATKQSMAYEYHGTCTPMEAVERDDSWSPTVADSTAAGSYKLITYRTKYGLVRYRATVGGTPVAYTSLRSSYRHEVDSIVGFEMLNDPNVVHSATTFQQAVSHINYTFNWFYVDSKDIAYYNSGVNPVRPAGVDPNLPTWAKPQYEWVGWDPGTNTATNTAFAAHPNSIDQDYYISWNNKQAKQYTSAGYGKGSVYRSNLLDSRIKALINSGNKISRADVVKAMEDAGVTDLRGEDVLPDLLQVIDTAPVTDPTEAAAVSKLRSWLNDGAKRKESSAGSHSYADSDAVRIMDAWWPLLVKAEFEPGMGSDLYTKMTGALQIDESPSSPELGTSHKGSAFQSGWWSYVDKDLRAVLGKQVAGPLGEKYCGAGSVSACRSVLLSTLAQAAATPADTVYPGDDNCSAGDQWCSDAIIQRPLGGISDDTTNWQNRPTFQQVVQFPTHR